MAFDGGYVGGGCSEVAIVGNHVTSRRPSHPFLLLFNQTIGVYNTDVCGSLVRRYGGVGHEVDGVGASDVVADTLCKLANFVSMCGAPFGTLAAVE